MTMHYRFDMICDITQWHYHNGNNGNDAGTHVRIVARCLLGISDRPTGGLEKELAQRQIEFDCNSELIFTLRQ